MTTTPGTPSGPSAPDASGSTSTLERARAHSPRQLAAASVGNLVEWYDWYAYSFLAVYFATQVFPESESGLTQLLNTFAIFAVGFFFRPVGGLLMGALADRIGRKPALTATILLMGAGSLLIAVLPTYASVGILSPILLVLARVIQGLSVGGEFAAATTFLVESAPPKRRGFFSSFQYVSTTIGQLLASGLAAWLASSLSEGDMQSWGWRIPFFVGAGLSLVGLVIRAGAHETLEDAEDLRTGRTARPGLFDALKHHPRESLLIVGITIAGTIAYYTWTTYLPTYAQTYADVSKADSLQAGTIALVFFALLQPVMGTISDRIGRKPLLITFAAFFVVATVPLLRLLDTSMSRLLLVQCIGMVFLAMFTSISAAVNAETIPARVRASGIGFPYSLSVALFGGTAPYVGTWFKGQGMDSAFPIYISVLCLVSLLVYVFALRETAHKPLP
ncbi:MHS family alpha-ketoglutarate permease-like MFS transporter [Knoellia remsis]|uniref:Putative proline/betaine transporter n=1 Tax=Knoellia remsis TaxID=407159 RepID=A0A2T0UFS3_9MICO|nr:MFS transporter [Knoellia remsis]PRY56667.1 MHS family alpha-ketoglutarate permease-like MFS transporter [Knoellia remsis]